VPTNPFNNLGDMAIEAFAAFCGNRRKTYFLLLSSASRTPIRPSTVSSTTARRLWVGDTITVVLGIHCTGWGLRHEDYGSARECCFASGYIEYGDLEVVEARWELVEVEREGDGQRVDGTAPAVADVEWSGFESL